MRNRYVSLHITRVFRMLMVGFWGCVFVGAEKVVAGVKDMAGGVGECSVCGLECA